MGSTKGETLKSRRNRRVPLLAVVLGAVFLLAGGVMSIGALLGSPEPQAPNMLAVAWPNAQASGVLSAQVSSTAFAAPEAPELVFLGNSSLIAATPPVAITPKVLGAILGETQFDVKRGNEVVYYVAQEGDTIERLAEQFGISQSTILWANDLPAGARLQQGDDLIILPVSGALHLVRPGDTLSEIALWYRGDVQDILEFNELVLAEDIFVGDLLVIPDGRKPDRVPAGRLTPLANSYFIYPVPRSWRITQGSHPFNAVDFANGECGGPVYAAAGGTVQIAGRSSGYGNYVRVLHPSGVVTLYAHLSGFAVGQGERVLRGATIGYVGHTGRTVPAGSGGCHLHFEVRGADNPFL